MMMTIMMVSGTITDAKQGTGMYFVGYIFIVISQKFHLHV